MIRGSWLMFFYLLLSGCVSIGNSRRWDAAPLSHTSVTGHGEVLKFDALWWVCEYAIHRLCCMMKERQRTSALGKRFHNPIRPCSSSLRPIPYKVQRNS